jgi:hypothetical protein
MKVITFTKELLPKVLDGTKTVTRRVTTYSKSYNPMPVRRYKAGDICAVKATRFSKEVLGYIIIEHVIYTRPVELINNDSSEFVKEGFADSFEFWATWAKLHPGNDYLCNVDRIRFSYHKGEILCVRS